MWTDRWGGSRGRRSSRIGDARNGRRCAAVLHFMRISIAWMLALGMAALSPLGAQHDVLRDATSAPRGPGVPSSRESGRFGGNLEYSRFRSGTTGLLPVSQLGALPYVGDGHAAQGDGELTGDATILRLS